MGIAQTIDNVELTINLIFHSFLGDDQWMFYFDSFLQSLWEMELTYIYLFLPLFIALFLL
jgi:hypothetical protein